MENLSEWGRRGEQGRQCMGSLLGVGGLSHQHRGAAVGSAGARRERRGGMPHFEQGLPSCRECASNWGVFLPPGWEQVLLHHLFQINAQICSGCLER